jgi:hypothetical protein
MRTVVPYTRLDERVLTALRDAGVEPELRDVSASVYAYWSLVRELWAAGDDFAIVEHDIVVRPGLLDEYAGCPEAWCVASYHVTPTAVMNSFGCVRFRGVLTREHPVFESPRLAEPVRWWSLDSTVEMELMARLGHAKCQHGYVEHLHVVE